MALVKTMVKGKLYGVGVGPGDPELMTVKCWRLVSTTKVIAYLAANGGESMARSIAAPFIPEDVEEIVIDMPMRTDRQAGQRAYDMGARQISAHLDDGHDVVMLCEGDPFFYGSFMYVFERLSGQYETVIVPGVTSVTAAAAAVAKPLCGRDDVLKVLPATMDEAALERELASASSAVIIKVGRHFGKLRRVLQNLNLEDAATAVEYATHDRQMIRQAAQIGDDTLPYFTTVIIRKDER